MAELQNLKGAGDEWTHVHTILARNRFTKELFIAGLIIMTDVWEVKYKYYNVTEAIELS